MPRPKKCRRIGFVPKYNSYGPVGSKNNLSPISIQLDELEAIRLKDLEKLDQVDAACLMGVSRQTFQNILESAREKIALSLLNGNTIIIEGGHIILNSCTAICSDCGESYNMQKKEWHGQCEKCGSTNLYCPQKNKKCCH